MLKIEPPGPGHDREGFDCGSGELNDYLKKTARQHLEKGLSKTFVLVDDGKPELILGFLTLAVCEVQAQTLPPKLAKKYPRHVPAAKLARLAVAKDRQREGLGQLMMVHALQQAIRVGDSVGIVGFFVDAKNEDARRYYEQYGFMALADDPLKLFLPLATLRQALV
jgi:ribosomal protein S18 acetylase RimI-like enzyme